MAIIFTEEAYEAAVCERHKIHRFPELGHQERKTTERIRRFLQRAGIEILDYPLETGLVARIKGEYPGEVLAIREDIDALPIAEKTGLPYASQCPGISHSCGHDIHTAVLMLTAESLNRFRKKLCGTLLFIFQPAEESCDGAVSMLEAGVLKQHPAGQIVGFHCSPAIALGKVGIISGINNASCDVVKLVINGHGGHGAHPEDCVDPIMAAGLLLTQMQTLLSRELSPQVPAVLTFGQIYAGTSPNVIPDQAVLCGTLRTLDAGARAYLLDAIPRMAENCCRAMRADCKVTFEKGMPPLVNAPDITERFAAAALRVLGGDSVVRLSAPSMGSDDFSCLLEQCGGEGGQFLLGTQSLEIANSGLGLHNSRTVFPDEAIRYGAAVLCQYALDTLTRSKT